MTVDAIYALLLANNPQEFEISNNIRVARNEQEIVIDGTFLGQISKQFLGDELNENQQISIIKQ